MKWILTMFLVFNAYAELNYFAFPERNLCAHDRVIMKRVGISIKDKDLPGCKLEIKNASVAILTCHQSSFIIVSRDICEGLGFKILDN